MTSLSIGLDMKARQSGAGGGGPVSPYDPASDAIFAGFTIPPTEARKTSIDTCVKALKLPVNVWDKLDELQLHAAADSQAALVNWVKPGTYNGVLVNSPAFTADRGFTGANTAYIDSLFLPTTAPSPKYVLDSANLFAWSLTSTGIDADIAGADTSAAIAFQPRRTSNVNIVRMHQGTTNISVASTDATGLWADDRSSSVLTTLYRNGVSQGTNAAASTTLANFKLSFLKGQGTFWTGQIAAGGFGQSLSAAEHTALYNALAGYIADIAVEKIVAAFTTPPTAGRVALIRACVFDLVKAGVWDKLDEYQEHAAADSQAALVNWVKPGTYNGTLVNSPAFTADQGFTGAASKYIDTGFNPTTAPTPKFTQNDASLFAWSLTATAITGGILNATTTSYIYPKSAFNNNVYAIVNGQGVVAAIADALGLTTACRASSTSMTAYRNAVSIGTNAGASVAPGNATFRFGLSGTTEYWTGGVMAGGGFGGNLTAADVTALYNAKRAYLTGVGVP
jgi:hypothetical protein